MEKKVSKTWYLAATHFLTAGIVIPIIVGIAFFFLTISFVDMNAEGSPANPQMILPIHILSTVVSIVSVWLGVLYSARYLREKYDLSDAANVIKLSTIYFISITLLVVFFDLLAIINTGVAPFQPTGISTYTYIAVDIIAAIASIYIFYRTSKAKLQQFVSRAEA